MKHIHLNGDDDLNKAFDALQKELENNEEIEFGETTIVDYDSIDKANKETVNSSESELQHFIGETEYIEGEDKLNTQGEVLFKDVLEGKYTGVTDCNEERDNKYAEKMLVDWVRDLKKNHQHLSFVRAGVKKVDYKRERRLPGAFFRARKCWSYPKAHVYAVFKK